MPPYTVSAGAQESGSQPEAGAITWQEAMKKMGQQVTVEAVIVNVYDPDKRGKKGPVKLNVDRNWKESLTFVLFNRDGKFGDPAQFLNKKVQVTGTVGEFRGSTQIKVESPSDIKIVD
jgi:DNA/RNA endonuclease YhcR with UshA esterase domain